MVEIQIKVKIENDPRLKMRNLINVYDINLNIAVNTRSV